MLPHRLSRTARASWPSRFSALQVAAGRRDLVRTTVGVREVLEQRDGVGERLVEREQVGVARVEVVAMQPVQQGVGRLVGDDVERLAGEDRPAGQRIASRPLARREVAEEQGVRLGVVVGVGLAQGVGVDPQAGDVLIGCRDHLAVGVAFEMGRPERDAAQRLLERGDRRHRDRVAHLLMELRVGLGRRQAVLSDEAAGA